MKLNNIHIWILMYVNLELKVDKYEISLNAGKYKQTCRDKDHINEFKHVLLEKILAFSHAQRVSVVM